MKFEMTETSGWHNAIVGMRNPMKSWNKSDTKYDPLAIGENDLSLMRRLLSTGSDSDGKFLRMVNVAVQITAPAYWWAELDTYKIGTVRDSCSIQHTGAKRDYEISDFSLDSYDNTTAHEFSVVLKIVNRYRLIYKETGDYTAFRVMRQIMPMGINYTAMWSANYAVLRNIYRQRVEHPHRLKEWTKDFAEWVDSLPYSELIKGESDAGGIR